MEFALKQIKKKKKNKKVKRNERGVTKKGGSMADKIQNVSNYLQVYDYPIILVSNLGGKKDFVSGLDYLISSLSKKREAKVDDDGRMMDLPSGVSGICGLTSAGFSLVAKGVWGPFTKTSPR